MLHHMFHVHIDHSTWYLLREIIESSSGKVQATYSWQQRREGSNGNSTHQTCRSFSKSAKYSQFDQESKFHSRAFKLWQTMTSFLTLDASSSSFPWVLFKTTNTLGTFNHGLDPFCGCFITHFGVGSSHVASAAPWCPPGAPWCPPGPPGTPLTPGMSSLAIHNHPGSLWVLFDPSGVNNSSVCTSIHCTAL